MTDQIDINVLCQNCGSTININSEGPLYVDSIPRRCPSCQAKLIIVGAHADHRLTQDEITAIRGEE